MLTFRLEEPSEIRISSEQDESGEYKKVGLA